MEAFAPEAVHRTLLDAARPTLVYRADRPLAPQQRALRNQLAELVACPDAEGDLDLRIEHRPRRDGFTETRFVVTSEPGARVPGRLLVPEDSPRPVPIFLCLQGHSRGMRLSLGEGDRETIGERDFALQAVNRSRADALCHGLV
jgi:Abhydrolase family